MKEIITIQLGGCGNTLGSMFWEDVFYEHQITNKGKISNKDCDSDNTPLIFLHETKENTFSPRTILVDSDPSLLEKIKSNPILSLIPDSFHIVGEKGNEINYFKGRKDIRMLERTLEACRKSAESCEKLQAFQFFHSTAGGTGSGLMTNLLENLEESYPDLFICTFSCLPTQKISELPFEILNSCLGISSLIEHASTSLLLDSDKMLASLIMHSEFTKFEDLNQIMRKQVSDLTSLLRFPGTSLNSYFKLTANMVPFPRLHFFNMTSSYELPNIPKTEIISETLNSKHLFYQEDNKNCRYMASAAISRGYFPNVNIKKELNSWIEGRKNKFCEWIPQEFVHCHKDVVNKGTEESFSFLQNSMTMRKVFKRISLETKEVLRKKLFLGYYFENGMDEEEFVKAEYNLIDLCDEYVPWICDEWDEDYERVEKNSEDHCSRYSNEEQSCGSDRL